MKFLKALGGVLCFIGCVIAMAGILATVIPLIDNAQVQRIVESFSMVSTDRLVNLLNRAILFCLAHNNWVFAIGAALLLAGGLLRSGADRALFGANAPRSGETRPAKTEPPRSAVPAQTAEPPAPPQEKPVKPLSPYAAAEYGRALTRDAKGRVASELAEKYKPRSIIDLPAIPEQEEPLLDRWRAPAEPEPEPISMASVATSPPPAPQRVCPNCGSLYAPDASFCPHCGLSLQSAGMGETQTGITAPYAAAVLTPQDAAPVRQPAAPIPAPAMPALSPQPTTPAYGESPQAQVDYAAAISPPLFTAQPTANAVAQGASVAQELWQYTPTQRQPRIVSTVQGVPFTPAAPMPAQSTEAKPAYAAAVNHVTEPMKPARPRIVSTMGRKREP